MTAQKYPVSVFFCAIYLTIAEAKFNRRRIVSMMSGKYRSGILMNPFIIDQTVINVGVAIRKLDIQHRYVWTIGGSLNTLKQYRSYELRLQTNFARKTMILLSGVLKAENFGGDLTILEVLHQT